ncbi:MAG: DNA replication/repair protein RecF [Bacilli bacterium]|nr:DNA replication/repair protein RecF [Bacilli bacterium]
MKVTNLELTNFRNYKYLSAEFSDGINYIVGENAKGKTNLVEAIYTLSFGKSFRTNDTLEMINKDSKYSIIKAKTKSETSSKDIDVYLLSEGKKIRVNKKPISKLSDLNGIINVLCFTPKDVNLLKDSPSQRRKFLNQNISKNSKIYLSSLMDYEKVLKQRNDLLKQEKVNFDYLGILTDYLVRLSKPIYEYRQKFVKRINEILKDVYKNISLTDEVLKIKYKPFLDSEEHYEEELQELYKAQTQEDLKKKVTTIGVHKEDFNIYLGDKNLGVYGSQGENRLAIISLKIAPYFLAKSDKEKPVIVLDDVLSELDENHEKNLLNYLKTFNQVFITNTKKSDYYQEKYYICDNDNIVKED